MRYSDIIRRLIAVAIVGFMLGGSIVTAQATTLASHGRLDYNNGTDDPSDDVVIDSADIVALATGIDTLNTTITGLQTDLSNQIISKLHYAGIVKDGDELLTNQNYNNLLAKLDGIEHDPLAESASVSYYGGGLNNPTITTVAAAGDQEDVNVGSVTTGTDGTTIDLHVNQQVTLPAGYYDKPITIKNAVQNRGSTPLSLTKGELENGYTVAPGYYGEYVITSAYDLSAVPNATIVYTHHQCSTTQTGLTYDSALIDTSEASPVATKTASAGGCFSKLTELYHDHTGSATSGGGCYTTPKRYHQHTGNSSTYGGCYTVMQSYSHYHDSSCYSSYYVEPFSTTSTCSSCGGSGRVSGSTSEWVTCNWCGGYGGKEIWVNGKLMDKGPDCPKCGNAGGWYEEKSGTSTCSACGGSGSTTYSGGGYYDSTLSCGMSEGSYTYYTTGCGMSTSTVIEWGLGCAYKDKPNHYCYSSYYVTGCGYSNGQVIKVTIFYE